MSSPVRTKALVATATNSPFQFHDILLPSLQPDEALVEIHAVGVCHAELSVLNGAIPLDFPRVLGHEGAGVVKEAGTAIKNIDVGQKVLLSFNHCQTCSNCKVDLPGYCVSMWERNWAGKRPDGSSTITDTSGESIYGNFFGQSSFSRLAVVNVSCIVPVLDDIKVEQLSLLAPLGCGVQTGVGTITNALNVKQGDSVAIFGAGAVGMSAIMGAKLRKAKIIIAVDLHSERLTLAQELGATHTIKGDATDIVDQINTICSPTEGLRYAVDTTGVSMVIGTMIKALGKRGKAASVGVGGAGNPPAVEVLDFVNQGKQWIGVVEGDSDPKKMVPWLVERWKEGVLPLEKIVKTYRVKDVEEALEDMRSGKTIKPVLLWERQDHGAGPASFSIES